VQDEEVLETQRDLQQTKRFQKEQCWR